MKKRSVELVVISDVHLGTYGCHAKELLTYLKSIDPAHIILNGDIIDIWQFSKRYWPKSHMQLVRYIMKLVSQGTRVDYITGNHDELLRKFDGFELGSFKICNKVLLTVDEKKTWFFHGDIFDVTMKHSKWLAKLGAIGYDSLILINRLVNWALEKSGKNRISLSKKVKNSVKGAVKFIDDFEMTAVEIAIENGYDAVCCGHIHQPSLRNVKTDKGEVTYLNSGDWVENLTSLEYNRGKWTLYQYEELDFEEPQPNWLEEERVPSNKELFQAMMLEFSGSNSRSKAG